VLNILRAELALTMRQCGTPAIAQITRASILENGARLQAIARLSLRATD
jgi:isopentenyl diphosphate isomerase/L-lactate dehydrogenase-like FMN-dependent dehydrogenase